MKEIIKYLRTSNSFTQDEVAKKLGISRQSYIKYEKGTVIPSEEIIEKLASLYNVQKDFIYKNKIPKPIKYYYDIGTIPEGYIESPSTAYNENGTIVYDAYFDGNAVHVIDPNVKFAPGQKLQIVVRDEANNVKRKESIDFIENEILKFRGIFKFDKKDPYYKKALAEARDEKYGRFD